MSPHRAAAILALLALPTGCRYSVERSGSERVLDREAPRVIGVTTATDVALALGPPDEVRVVGDELWFVYRSRRATSVGVALHYYVALAKRVDRDEAVRSVIAIFDRDGRLRSFATDRSLGAR